MIHDGIKLRRSNHLGWRKSDPTKDFDLDGQPVKSNYVSIVRMKDCRIYKKDGITYYDPKDAPSIPINHGGTYYGYGKWRKRYSTFGTWIKDKLYHEYYTVPIYVVSDGRVYQGTIRHAPKKCVCGFVGNKLQLREHIHDLTGTFTGTDEHKKFEYKEE